MAISGTMKCAAFFILVFVPLAVVLVFVGGTLVEASWPPSRRSESVKQLIIMVLLSGRGTR